LTEILIETSKINNKFHFSVFEVKNDEKYEIKFKSGKNDVTLEIELGPEFPYKTPKLFLNPILIHPWCENNEILHFPGLLNVNLITFSLCRKVY
jgi:hypothetical protein